MQRCHQILQQDGWKHSPPFYQFPAAADFAVCSHAVQSFRDDSHTVVAGREGPGARCSSECVPSWSSGCCWGPLGAFGCSTQGPACQPCRQNIFLASHAQDFFREGVAMQPCLFLVCDTVCLLSLYTWKGEPAVLLEKGSSLTNGHPCFQFWKHRVRSRRNPHSLVGGNSSWGHYKLNNVEQDFQSEGHLCLWRRLVDSPVSCAIGFSARWCSGGLAGARQRGCFYSALVEVDWSKHLSQKAINSGKKSWFFLYSFSFQQIISKSLETAARLLLCAREFGCQLKETQSWEVCKESNAWGGRWKERRGQVGAAGQTEWFVDRKAPLHKKSNSLASATRWEAEQELPPGLRCCSRAPFAAMCGQMGRSPLSSCSNSPCSDWGQKAKTAPLVLPGPYFYFPGRTEES